MMFTDSLVLNGIGNIVVVNRSKYFLKYEPPNMGKKLVCDSKIQTKGPNHDQ